MQNYLPLLSEHFKKLRIPTDIYAANWFITMFCYELSLDLVFCILDVFLLDGIKSLLRVSLALLKFMEPILLDMNFDECMVYLSHCQKDLELDSQTLLQTAYTFKVTKKLLEELELFFKLRVIKKQDQTPDQLQQALYFNAFNRISLQESPLSGLHYWLVLPSTPEDMTDVITLGKKKHLKIDLCEEDILTFY